MNRIKPTMTPEKANRINHSVQFMIIMAEMMQMEYSMEVIDARFKNPQVNQFAKRISADLKAIHTHLLTNPNVQVKVSDNEFTEDYAGEMYRVFRYFIGLPLSQVKEVMDNLTAVAETMEG